MYKPIVDIACTYITNHECVKIYFLYFLTLEEPNLFCYFIKLVSVSEHFVLLVLAG